MKAISLTLQKIWPKLKFLQSDGQAKNYMTPDLSIRGHKKISKSKGYCKTRKFGALKIRVQCSLGICRCVIINP
jgi:hypothetical protein